MRRLFAVLMLVFLMLALALSVVATDEAELVETTAEPIPLEIPASDDESKIPNAEEIKQSILDTINKIDWSLSGVELWEDIKAWCLDHLSTIVGAIATIAAAVLGLLTKCKWVPKVTASFTTLGKAIEQWYTTNINSIKEFRKLIEGFLTTMKDTIEKVERQSQENNDLRRELNDALAENKELKEHYVSVEAALLKAALLDAQQHQRLVQLSGMSCADLDAEYIDYKARVEAIEALLPLPPDTSPEHGDNAGEESI